MRLMPKSLYGRLLALSAIATSLALIIAAVSIGQVLERFVTDGLDRRLDAELVLLARAVKPDGRIDLATARSLRPLLEPDPGWSWRIAGPHGALASPDTPAWRETERHDRRRPPHVGEPVTGRPPPPDHEDDDETRDYRPRPVEASTPDGLHVHGRRMTIATTDGGVTLAVAAPRAIVARPIRAALVPLGVSLAILGVALAAATLVQLRLGLRPLGKLRTALGDIRAGRATRIPDDQPTELQPLASELNALIADNIAALANARSHVANLAHGLKTPLATLTLALREEGRDPDGAMTAEVARIDYAIRHHLGRARAGAAGGAARVATPLAPAIDGLVEALGRIHAERGIAVDHAIAPDLAVAVDPQDLDELLGNLLDNAWRWAARRIAISATGDPAAARIHIAIEDDGPGIPERQRAAAVEPGRRLDESGDGHGFGLSITRELAELYGGALALDRSATGGLRAIVTLPRAAVDPG